MTLSKKVEIKKNNLSKEELLLIHLLINDEQEDKYYHSDKLTRNGINEELNCSMALECRILSENVERGRIKMIKSRVYNNSRLQDIFLLTKQGKKIALEIYNNNSKEKKELL